VSTRKLAGLFLTIGPIGVFLIWGILQGAVLGAPNPDPEAPTLSATTYLQANLDNQVAFNLLGILGGLSFFALLVGFGMLALEVRSGGGAGAGCAGAAALMFPSVLAIGVANWGLEKTAVDLAVKEGIEAGVPMQVIANGIGGGIGVLWGVGLLLLGVAIGLQKTVSAVLGWLLAVVGALLFVTAFLDTNSPVSFVVWIGLTLVTVAVGVSALRTPKAN